MNILNRMKEMKSKGYKELSGFRGDVVMVKRGRYIAFKLREKDYRIQAFNVRCGMEGDYWDLKWDEDNMCKFEDALARNEEFFMLVGEEK